MRFHAGFSFPIRRLLPFIGFLFVGLLAFFGIDKITAHAAVVSSNPNGYSVNAFRPLYANYNSIDHSDTGGTCSPTNSTGCSNNDNIYNATGCNNYTTNGTTYCMFRNNNSTSYFSIVDYKTSSNGSKGYLEGYNNNNGYRPHSKLVWTWKQANVNYCTSGTLTLYYTFLVTSNNTILNNTNRCAHNIGSVTGSIGYCSNFVTVNGNQYSGVSLGDGNYSVIIPKPTTDLTITIPDIQPFLTPLLSAGSEGGTTSSAMWNYGMAITGYECASSSSNIDSNTIINNQNQNTQTIITNDNNNTNSINSNIQGVGEQVSESASNIIDAIEDLKDNQDENTQEIIDSQKVCEQKEINNVISSELRGQLNLTTGAFESSSSSTSYTSDFIRYYGGDINVIKSSAYTTPRICFYDSDKLYISCSRLDLSWSIPSNTYYFRFSYRSDGKPILSALQCKNGNQAIYDSINDDSYNDGGQLGGLDGKFDDFGIDDLAKTPLQLLQNIYNANENSCSSLVLPITIGVATANPSIPCGNEFWNSFPSSAVSLYHMLVFGLSSWFIVKKLIKLVEKSLDPDDKSEMVNHL